MSKTARSPAYMAETEPQKTTFDWKLMLYASAGTLLVFLPFALNSADVGEFFYIFVAAPIVSLVLFVLAGLKKGRGRISALSMLAVYWAVSVTLVVNYSAVRDHARWFLWSKGYKARVLSLPASGSGRLRHTEWDGWGFAGEDTVVYIVFDSNDSLAMLGHNKTPGKLSGLPCEVPRIRRLESHWYAVMFYTDTSWDHCG
jgi:hypothetical protein